MLANIAFLILFCWMTYRVGRALDTAAHYLLDRLENYLRKPPPSE